MKHKFEIKYILPWKSQNGWWWYCPLWVLWWQNYIQLLGNLVILKVELSCSTSLHNLNQLVCNENRLWILSLQILYSLQTEPTCLFLSSKWSSFLNWNFDLIFGSAQIADLFHQRMIGSLHFQARMIIIWRNLGNHFSIMYYSLP